MQKELEFAKKLALEPGQLMVKHFGKKHNTRFKHELEIVTGIDEEINRNVISAVSKEFPDYSVIGEEESNSKKSELVWICDPIDGTWPYSKGLPAASFSLALVRRGVPLIGVAYNPFLNKLYTAQKGRGAYLNDKRIHVSHTELKHSTINIEWWPEAEYDVETAMHGFSLDTYAYVLHLGSIVTASCLVASGQYEACVYAGTTGKSVDIAAVKVIVEEAGGKATDLFGNNQLFVKDINGAVISNGSIHKKILAYTSKLKKRSLLTD
ncbi:MAG: hypothetical protein PHS44_05255 [Candidatus Dojkabacteria bacterium]|nr:hypothetical protein [Candidatus Dojkabacteria bacterium]